MRPARDVPRSCRQPRGQPDDEHRAAYDELISDADRAALGARTRAAGVFRDAVAWGVQIDQDLRMDEVQRCFNEAHATTQLVRRLSPGPATRHVLGTKKTGKPTSKDTPAAPAASSADAAAT